MSILRFAPTPNGPLHLGHAYCALRNAETARRLGGPLLLRFEDIDPSRCRPEYEAGACEDLDWLGIAFAPNPLRQSEHAELYAAALQTLRGRGLAYACYCTRGQIAATGQGRDPDGAARHRGRCVAVSPQETKARLARGEPSNWRLDLEAAVAQTPQPPTWREFYEGEAPLEMTADPGLWGDTLVGSRERVAVYHLAVVVDDALQGVSDVVRGRDLEPATCVHRLLQNLLGLPAPNYRHHRLVLGPDGRKLSKSAGSPSLRDLRAQGRRQEEIRSALGFAGPGADGLEVRLS